MPVIRIPQRDVGGGPPVAQVPRGAAAGPGLAAARAIEQAGRAIAGVSATVAQRQDAKTFARENQMALQIFEEGAKAIDDELERGVREEGWDEARMGREKIGRAHV